MPKISIIINLYLFLFTLFSSLNCERPQLNIQQAVKGEACGHLRVTGQDFNSHTGSAIPVDMSDLEFEILPQWVLVIEKYAVYEMLVSAKYTENKPVLLVTGRGKYRGWWS